jgi:hypothetical protein
LRSSEVVAVVAFTHLSAVRDWAMKVLLKLYLTGKKMNHFKSITNIKFQLACMIILQLWIWTLSISKQR